MHEYPSTGFAVSGYCGSPLVGSCLRGKYRHYHCRGTYCTGSRDRICSARYIQAEWLEGVVWDRVKEVLRKPELLLAGVRKQTEVEKAEVESGTLDQEIKAIRRELKEYATQERRLIEAFKLGLPADAVLDQMNQVKKAKETDQPRLASLIQTWDNVAKMSDYEARLKEHALA